MPGTEHMAKPFNIVIIAQAGRLQYEAALFAASLRQMSPGFTGRLFVAVPQTGPAWVKDPSVRNRAVLELLARMGAEILPFENTVFGDSYPNGNKIEALSALPKGEPFVFFDSDTLVTGELSAVPFDFDRPSASLRRENSWPKPTLYGPGHAGIWKALYDRFDLDFDSSLDLTYPEADWRRYLYFNAGFFYGTCPHQFGQLFLNIARDIRDAPPKELAGQALYPWLDQIALPLVIHALGGGRGSLPQGFLDGQTTCHYRILPLLYAREDDRVVSTLEEVCAPNAVKKVLKNYEPMLRMIYQGRGRKVRALFDRSDLPKREQAIRKRIKAKGLWMR